MKACISERTHLLSDKAPRRGKLPEGAGAEL
jgi:hypothetical protein